MQQNLSSSLVALAILAFREGDTVNAARLLGQAAVSPDVECFLKGALTHNLEALSLVRSVTQDDYVQAFGQSVQALSAALDTEAEEEISMSFGNDVEDQARADALAEQSDQEEDYQQMAEDDERTAIEETPREEQATLEGANADAGEVQSVSSSPIKFNFSVT